MDNIAAFLSETSVLCITFTIDGRLSRELPLKSAAIRTCGRQENNLLIKQNQVSVKELPEKLRAANFWLPRAYRKPVPNSQTRVNAVFHLVKYDTLVAPTYDTESSRALRIFENLCQADTYQLGLYKYERPGCFGLHCIG